MFFCCLLAGSNGFLHAQNYLQPSLVTPELLGVKQGLSQGMINCIYQDKEGYLWISTKDGLNRYDGYNILTYRNDPNDPYSLPDNYCNATLEDDKGNFWVGTNTRGLFLFDKATERFYPVTAINSNKENLCIREAASFNGKLFLKTFTDAIIADISQVDLEHNGPAAGSKPRLIFCYNQVQANRRYKMANTMSLNSNCWMPDNALWINFPDSIFHVKPNAAFSSCSISAFSPASLGMVSGNHNQASYFPLAGEPETVLIAYENVVIHFNTNTRQVSYKKILPVIRSTYLNKYYPVKDGSICSFTDSSVYIYYPAARKEAIVPLPPMGIVVGLFTDANDILWYGTNGYGLMKNDSRKNLFKSFKSIHSAAIFWKLPPDLMPPLAKQLTGRYEINRVLLDHKGVYWTYLAMDFFEATYRLSSYNTQTGKLMHYSGLPDNHVRQSCIYNDPSDRLWIYYQDWAKKNRIARMDKNTGTVAASYNIPEDIEVPNPYVSQLYMDEKGMMWLATINGLYAFNETTKAWKHWKNAAGNNNSLSSDKLLSICPDPASPEKYLWIGTEGAGFNRFEKSTGNCVRYDEKDGLPNNVAYCILGDSLNNLWISTNKGLSCFNPAQRTFRNFTDDDGLPGNEFNRNTALRIQNGELMFGGVDGFVIFNPKEVLQKQRAVPIVFTGISIFNKSINWKTDSANLQAPVGYAKTLTLQPGQNIFSISFATLEFRSNAKKMYRYKLEGFDKDWTSPNSKNEVTYTNLSPGTYTFRVMGANTDGVWNEKPISIRIIVLPYFYQTWWFKILLLLLFGAGLYAFYRYRIRQALKLEKLRNRIARDLHDEIGSTLSSISIYAESVKKVTKGNEKAEVILSKINAGTTEMMEAMSDIVWAVNTGNDQFDDLANRLRAFAVQVTEAKHIELHFTDNENIPAMQLNMEQRKNIYLICKEAISNAVKHSSCTVLDVQISKEQNDLTIQVRDNGKGFESAGKQAHSFGGNGIKNMKGRAAEINAALEVITEPGQGTVIKLVLA